MKRKMLPFFIVVIFLFSCVNPLSENPSAGSAGQDTEPVLLEIEKESINSNVPPGYYANAAGKTGAALKTALHEIIKGHTKLSYTAVWNALKETDEDPNNPNNVILLYSRRSQSKQDNGGGANQWNREHSWPKSHGFPSSGQSAYTDIHHLRPTDTTVNSARGTKDFDDGGSVAHSKAPLCRATDSTWEPPDVVKGDIARMMFYMAVRYEGGSSGEPDLELVEDPQVTSSGSPKLANINTLLRWHSADPVSETEIRRNDIIYSKYQGNRNPFIDNPAYVQEIWGNGGGSGTGGGTGDETVLFEDNFNSSTFGPGWSTDGLNSWRVQLTTSYSPRDSYHAVLDSSAGGTYSTSRLKLSLDFSGVTNLKVEYYYKESGDENHNTDGLYIYNGNWIKVHSFNNGPSTWTKQVVDLSSYQNIQIIEWQQYDNYPMTSDGICIDNVKVYGTKTGGGGGGNTASWQERQVQKTSPGYPSNYGNNQQLEVSFTEPGAQKVKLYFSDFKLESGYDFVYIYDGSSKEIASYTGSKGAFTTIEVPGDTVKVKFTSDYSVTDKGWSIQKFHYYK